MGFDQITDRHAPDRRNTGRARASLAAGALLVTMFFAGWGAAGTAGTAASAVVPAPTAVDRPLAPATDSYAAVVERTAPAVVTIRSERRVRSVSHPFADDPRFREFFGRRAPGPQPERREGGLGSGVIVRADGYILTNHHVIDGADQVRVELSDGRLLTAEVVGSDPPSDLAVLKIDERDLPTLALANSDEVRVGDVVLALGNPLGVGQTVTMGIVSAKGRAVGAGDGSFEDFIQTDAPINRGNSGGALVSTSGELVGINSAILSPSGVNIGIGFAIPANLASNVMTQLIEHGEVRRGMLGVTVQPLTSDIARSLGLEGQRGALLSSVQAGSPGEKAGLRRGDVVTAINGQAVTDGNVLRNQVAQLQPGTDATVTVLRGGRERTFTVTLAELQASRTRGGEGPAAPGDSGTGLALAPVPPAQARELGLDANTGVLVTGVRPGSRAAEAGIREGDVIEEVDGRTVATADAVRSALARGDRPALVLLHRDGATLFVTIERERA
jgi:serine protease Do